MADNEPKKTDVSKRYQEVYPERTIGMSEEANKEWLKKSIEAHKRGEILWHPLALQLIFLENPNG